MNSLVSGVEIGSRAKNIPRIRTATHLLAGAAAGSAAVVGAAAFSGHWQLLALSVLLPALLSLAATRSQALLVALAYQLAASRGLAEGAAEYYATSIAFGGILWIVGNLVSACTYAFFWSKMRGRQILGALVAMIFLALPPLGVFGWNSPLTAAGVLFPSLGFIGLGLAAGLAAALAARAWRCVAVLLLVSFIANVTYQRPTGSYEIRSISTAFGRPPESFEVDYSRQTALAQEVRRSRERLVVLPESSLLESNVASRRFWLSRILELESGDRSATAPRHIVVTGSTVPAGAGHKARNVMEVIGGTGRATYSQRQPVPLSMWKPWSTDGYEASWFANPVITVEHRQVAPLICYEAFLVWPVVQSLMSGADVIVAISNLWWAAKTNIPQGQHAIVEAWARLFRVPYVMAVNT